MTPTTFEGGKYILCPSRTGHLLCLRCVDGSEMWRRRLFDTALTSVGFDANSRPSDRRADQSALASIGCADGTVLLLQVCAAGVGVIKRTQRVGERVFSSPLMMDGRVMVGYPETTDCIAYY